MQCAYSYGELKLLTAQLRKTSLLVSADACSTAPAAIDRYLLPAGRSAANPPLLLSIDGTDGRPTVT